MSSKSFKVVFIAADGRVTLDIDAGSGVKAVEKAIASLTAEHCATLGIDGEGRPVDAKHWKTEDGVPASAAKTEGLVLRTVTTVERVTGKAEEAY
jgi:hypothetical protein